MEGDKYADSFGGPGNLEPEYTGNYIYYIPIKTCI